MLKQQVINADKSRKQSVIISTVIAAIGIVVYQQSFGFIQLYLAPFNMAFPAIAAILIGGASVNRVTIWHVMIGTFLFQGILTMTPTVVNAVIKTDMSETIRIIVSNGMILYALTRRMVEVVDKNNKVKNFILDNSVPILILIMVAIMFPLSGLSGDYLVRE